MFDGLNIFSASHFSLPLLSSLLLVYSLSHLLFEAT